jgi:GNAT superfamily N-acetyltransferase
MAMRIAVRRAEEKDADEIARLLARLKILNSELDPHFLPSRDLESAVREYVRKSLESEKSLVLVAEDEEAGRIVGVLRLEIVDRLFYEPRYKALITDLYVHPQYRRKRIGRLLIERAAEEAKGLGAGMLAVVYPAGNTIADSFYAKMGFKDLQKEKYIPL